MSHYVLIVEDEENLARLIQDYLKVEAIDSEIIADGNQVLESVRKHPPDVILLDIMLPGQDGMSLCKEIRKFSEVPVIMTTARVDEIDRILGLEIGADDYVCKPYSPRELVARVKVQLRKLHSTVIDDSLKLDDSNLSVHKADKKIELTFVEYNLLKKLYLSGGRIFNRNQLMDSIYDDGRIVSDRTIDSHIKKIRKKLHELEPETEYIHSVYGCGYKFEKQ